MAGDEIGSDVRSLVSRFQYAIEIRKAERDQATTIGNSGRAAVLTSEIQQCEQRIHELAQVTQVDALLVQAHNARIANSKVRYAADDNGITIGPSNALFSNSPDVITGSFFGQSEFGYSAQFAIDQAVVDICAIANVREQELAEYVEKLEHVRSQIMSLRAPVS